MKIKSSKSIAFILAAILALAPLSSCTTTPSPDETTETESAVQSESSDKSDGSESEGNGNGGDVELPLSGQHADLIQLNNSLANGVQAYFTDGDRTHFNMQNTEMTMSYARSNTASQLVSSIKNTKGNTYIADTMDVFVRMTDGSTYYSSVSTASAQVNLYRLGYYYYEGLFEFQDFLPREYEIDVVKKIKPQAPVVSANNQVDFKYDAKSATYTITDATDPYFVYGNLGISTESSNVLLISARSTGSITACEVFFTTDEDPVFNEEKKLECDLISDGEYHTYRIYLKQNEAYTGKLTNLRIDLEGEAGDLIQIKEIYVGNADLDSIPKDLKISRHFHVYSDKMHHSVQLGATMTTENLESLGMETRISTSTVEKLMIVDKNGNHTSLEGVDWESAIAVAFDIKGAGIFGYVLPDIDEAGSISVYENDGFYVIEQVREIDGGTLYPSEKGTENGNDFYIGQRVYTDESHDFSEFLKETYIERNPIGANHVRIGANSNSSGFEGYDALRGIYVLNIETPSGGFYSAYNYPNKNYKVNFTIRGSESGDRDIYIMTSGGNGLLECAVLLDENEMLLPIPIEVIKNFSEEWGDRNFFNLDDPTFSEAIFMLSLKSGEKHEYNILNLYQNWGNYPLKQLSGIPYNAPYYHLSTGVTETNCIVPYFMGSALSGKGTKNNTLTDFRSMSAPYWQDQPQHNSCGSHSWLEYTDADGIFSASENINNTITSYGPTYAEIKMDYISDDGSIKVTYTHMEMPQTDENRVYYTMEYTVLEDVSFSDFKRDFQFYDVTDNDEIGSYKRLGYLNESNESVVVSAIESGEAIYKLGNICPYFSFYDMSDWNEDSEFCEGYANVALLIYNYEFVINGEKAEPTFVIVNENDHVRLSLDLDEVTLKAGDSFTINTILLPWGSQELNGKYDTLQDSQVREVRRNTLVDPLKATSDTDEVLESVYLPKIKSVDGKCATFTISGGENNVAVRVYGFEKLTAPVVERLVDGEWQIYDVSSKNNPDDKGYYHYYDGYSVFYDGDGTYSYSFVTTLEGDETATFRVTAVEDFAGWPQEMLPEEEEGEDLLTAYTDPNELYKWAQESLQMFSKVTKSNDGSYVTFNAGGVGGSREAYTLAYRTDKQIESGRYFVMKYRIKETPQAINFIELFISTINGNPSEGDNFSFRVIADGEWHVAIIDLEEAKAGTYVKSADGKYYAKYVRVDIFNSPYPENNSVDIAYVGFDVDLLNICEINKSEFDFVELYTSPTDKEMIDVNSGEVYVERYIDPSSGYTESNVAFAAYLDYINETPLANLFSYQSINIVKKSEVEVNADNAIELFGWCAADGGIADYVWSADGGLTWNKAGGEIYEANSKILSVAQEVCGTTFSDITLSSEKGSFQGKGINIDLSAYSGETVDVIFGAIPLSDKSESSIILIYLFEDVSVN